MGANRHKLVIVRFTLIQKASKLVWDRFLCNQSTVIVYRFKKIYIGLNWFTRVWIAPIRFQWAMFMFWGDHDLYLRPLYKNINDVNSQMAYSSIWIHFRNLFLCSLCVSLGQVRPKLLIRHPRKSTISSLVPNHLFKQHNV